MNASASIACISMLFISPCSAPLLTSLLAKAIARISRINRADGLLGRANGPGNKVPGPPAILSLPWPYQGSQLNLEKNQNTVL